MDTPPVHNLLTFNTSSVIRERCDEICKKFENKYGSKPTFVTRAPGRVNLIGEHIDYCGYAVLPMAVEQDITMAVTVNESGKIQLANTDAEFESYECSSAISSLVIDREKPRWQHYFLCGYRGMLEHTHEPGSRGLQVMVSGTVPRSAGLSSSSAMVCCAALATAHAYTVSCSKLEFSELTQHCERYIGTEGGGMDQSISFLAQPGTAKLIEFNPIRATDVTLPEGATFVVSNCCIEMNKAATAHFNTRVAECRLATQILSKLCGKNWREVKKLGDVQAQSGKSLQEMVQLVKDTFHSEAYTKKEVCEILQVTQEELNSISLSEKTYQVESFFLHDRALHVYTEALRVIQFKEICDSGKQGALQSLGYLMNQSHTSCSQLYDCSCPELDQLTQIARNSGALGSRLTGAGWGGCAVSLVAGDKINSFLKGITEGYYTGHPSRSENIEKSLFATQPGGGAAIFTV